MKANDTSSPFASDAPNWIGPVACPRTTVFAWSAATGSLLVRLIVTVAGSASTVPSLAVKVNESVPVSPAAEV